MKEIIKDLKTKKACGYDEVTNRVLKNLPKEGYLFLKILFNSCLRPGYFPKAWKLGKIVAIPKPGKEASLHTSYRPITLLPVLGKMLEKIILFRLQEIENELRIFIPQQCGFRAKHSTTHQIKRITNVVIHAGHRKSV